MPPLQQQGGCGNNQFLQMQQELLATASPIPSPAQSGARAGDVIGNTNLVDILMLSLSTVPYTNSIHVSGIPKVGRKGVERGRGIWTRP